MHYFAGVVIDPTTSDLDGAVDEAMAPHEEWFSEDEDSDDYGGLWDWYQIGGRWTGVWSDYDPETDPANIETCFLCAGTGTRSDAIGLEHGMVERRWCNGCDGKGVSTKWPTAWERHPGDVQPVSRLLDDPDARLPHVLIAPDAPPLENDDGWGPTPESKALWRKQALGFLEPYRHAVIVVVDYHS